MTMCNLKVKCVSVQVTMETISASKKTKDSVRQEANVDESMKAKHTCDMGINNPKMI